MWSRTVPPTRTATPDVVAHGAADADGDAQVPSADSRTPGTLPSDDAMTMPRIRASATGMAMGTATRSLRLLRQRRRHADRCRVGMQSTSIFKVLS